VGGDCDVSLYDTALSLLTYVATWHLNEGYEPTRMPSSAHPSLVPFQVFRARDGWLVVGCAKEKFWRRLVEVIARPDLGADPRYATFADRGENRVELLADLGNVFVERDVAEWLPTLAAAGVPSGPVNDVAQAMAEAHTEARGLLVESEHPAFGTVRMVRSPVRFGDSVVENRRAPRRNEDFDAVLRDLLGYDDDRVHSYAAAGAFGPLPDAAR
jgi:crotonobetainyl-CoA:carnitine CoA-transferase CaiB-like acyl-CoA transferase